MSKKAPAKKAPAKKAAAAKADQPKETKAPDLPQPLAGLDATVTPVDGGYCVDFGNWACKIHGDITEGRVAEALSRRPSK